MFERFTEPARRVVVVAGEEARALRHDYIGTEHFLLAVIRDDQSAASRLLSALAIQPDAVRQELEQLVPGRAGEPAGHLPFTPEAKQTLERGLLEAVRLDSPHIGTEHILLGLLCGSQDPAAQVLTALGADLEQARRAVREITPEDR